MIVNPYAKTNPYAKKKDNPYAKNNTSKQKDVPSSSSQPKMTTANAAAAPLSTASSTTAAVLPMNGTPVAKSRPPQVTPIRPKVTPASAGAVAGKNNNTASQEHTSHVTPRKDAPHQTTTMITPKANIVHRSSSGSSSNAAKTKKLTLKQKLKQDIAFLKKQKQLAVLEKQAQQRRQAIQKQRLEEQERRQQELQRRKEEQERLKEEKRLQRQRLEQEKLAQKLEKQKQRQAEQAQRQKEQEQRRLEKLAKQEEKRLQLLREEQLEQERYQSQLQDYQQAQMIYRQKMVHWQSQYQQKLLMMRSSYNPAPSALPQVPSYHPPPNLYAPQWSYPAQGRQQGLAPQQPVATPSVPPNNNPATTSMTTTLQVVPTTPVSSSSFQSAPSGTAPSTNHGTDMAGPTVATNGNNNQGSTNQISSFHMAPAGAPPLTTHVAGTVGPVMAHAGHSQGSTTTTASSFHPTPAVPSTTYRTGMSSQERSMTPSSSHMAPAGAASPSIDGTGGMKGPISTHLHNHGSIPTNSSFHMATSGSVPFTTTSGGMMGPSPTHVNNQCSYYYQQSPHSSPWPPVAGQTKMMADYHHPMTPNNSIMGGGNNYWSSSWLWQSLPPMPKPPVPPVRPKPRSRRQSQQPSSKPPAVVRLCPVMEPPCQYAMTHELLEITLVQYMPNETEQQDNSNNDGPPSPPPRPSFGVNLKCHTFSVLVDPAASNESAPLKHQTMLSSAPVPSGQRVASSNAVTVATTTINNPASTEATSTKTQATSSPPQNIVSGQGVANRTSSLTGAPKNTTNKPVISEAATLKSQPMLPAQAPSNQEVASSELHVAPITTNDPTTKEATSNQGVVSSDLQVALTSTNDSAIKEATTLKSQTMFPVQVLSNQVVLTSELQVVPTTTNKPAINEDATSKTPVMSPAQVPSNQGFVSSAPTIAPTVTTVATNQKKKRRRRRVNFAVMMVVDAEKQNTRRKAAVETLCEHQTTEGDMDDNQKEKQPKSTQDLVLLQPGDIVVNIGGVEIANMTFPEACAVFSQKAVTVGPNEIHAKLLVARRKPPPPKPTLPTLSKTVKSSPSSFDKGKLPGTKSKTPLTDESKSKTSALLDEKSSSKVSSSALVPANKKSSTDPMTMPSIVLSAANASLDFTPTELALLADGIIHAIHLPQRCLGHDLSLLLLEQTTKIFRQVAVLNISNTRSHIELDHRTTSTLQKKWDGLSKSMDDNLIYRAREFWRQTFHDECQDTPIDPLQLPFESESERSTMRQLPRPNKGCRCKRQDHEYLHDPKCSLYLDLRKRLSQDELSQILLDPDTASANNGKSWGSSKKVATSGEKEENLNVVQMAFKDRIVKLKTATELEEAEARFVARMEEIQVKECKKAIFSPNLTTMVLSTILELRREFPMSQPRREVADEEESLEDMSEDEEVGDEEHGSVQPLAQKRKSSSEPLSSSKKKKKAESHNYSEGEHRLNVKYLMRMLEFISKTWGHIYREPSNEEYAWRWELYHGHNSEDVQWESKAKNPRQPNSMPYENIRFGLSDLFGKASSLGSMSNNILEHKEAIRREVNKIKKPAASSITSGKAVSIDSTVEDTNSAKPAPVTSETQSGKWKSPQPGKNISMSENRALEIPSDGSLEQYCLAAHLLSPSSSGLYDELLALVKMGVLEIQKSSGIPTLAEDWASNVDIVLLDDMDTSWGTDSDPDGRFCVHEELRDTLEEQWVKSDYGWALVDDPEDLVFDFAVLDEWKQTFEGQMEEKANISEGIGRFGL